MNKWRLFDKGAQLAITTRNRPHWDQPVLTFVTMRLADSMPKTVVEQWLNDQRNWLRQMGQEKFTIEQVLYQRDFPENLRRSFKKYRRQKWHESLDSCHGSCVLESPECAKIVSDSLLKFNGERYDMERFVIMPNHVHMLVQMRHPWGLRRQCKSWTRFTGRKINGLLNTSGDFWQTEPFDHLVRSENQFTYLRRYIDENPQKANLQDGRFLLWYCEQ